MRRVVVSGLAALVVTVALGAPAGAENGADGREVTISLDGEYYQQETSDPLFDPSFRWVPGDVRISRFWVRNEADEAGDLTIDLVPRERTDLFRSGYLTVSARAGRGTWTTARSDTELRLLSAKDLPSRAAVPVSIRVSVAADAPNGTMVLGTDFDFRVTLADARAGGPDGTTDDPSGSLPDTGASTSWWVVPLGLLLVAAGALLLRRRETPQPSGDRT